VTICSRVLRKGREESSARLKRGKGNSLKRTKFAAVVGGLPDQEKATSCSLWSGYHDKKAKKTSGPRAWGREETVLHRLLHLPDESQGAEPPTEGSDQKSKQKKRRTIRGSCFDL